MSDDFTSSGFKSILEYGINLKLESEDEEIYYTSRMCEYFNEESDFKAYLSGDRSFEIEINQTTPIMEITIMDSVLTIMPYTDDIFEAFSIMLAFIAKKHREVVNEIRPSMPFRIESIDEINNTEEDETNNTEEPSSDDDYEWI